MMDGGRRGFFEFRGRIFDRKRKFDGTFGLFDGKNGEILSFQFGDGFIGSLEIAPRDGILGSEGGFVDFVVGRRGGDAAEIDRLHAKSVACAENAADIVERAHIVEHDHERQFFGLAELINRQPVHFKDVQFAHCSTFSIAIVRIRFTIDNRPLERVGERCSWSPIRSMK